MDRSSDGSKFIEGRVKIGRKRYRFSAEKFLCFSDDSDDEPPIQISGKPASTAKPTSGSPQHHPQPIEQATTNPSVTSSLINQHNRVGNNQGHRSPSPTSSPQLSSPPPSTMVDSLSTHSESSRSNIFETTRNTSHRQQGLDLVEDDVAGTLQVDRALEKSVKMKRVWTGSTPWSPFQLDCSCLTVTCDGFSSKFKRQRVGASSGRFSWFKINTSKPTDAEMVYSKARRNGLSIRELEHDAIPSKLSEFAFHFYTFAVSDEDVSKVNRLIDEDFVGAFNADTLLKNPAQSFFFHNIDQKDVIALCALATHYNLHSVVPPLPPMQLLENDQNILEVIDNQTTMQHLENYLSKKAMEHLARLKTELEHL